MVPSPLRSCSSNGRRLLVGLLISTLDTTIVSTSLVTISNDLDDFVNAPWIVLAYLLTYMGSNHALAAVETHLF